MLGNNYLPRLIKRHTCGLTFLIFLIRHTHVRSLKETLFTLINRCVQIVMHCLFQQQYQRKVGHSNRERFVSFVNL